MTKAYQLGLLMLIGFSIMGCSSQEATMNDADLFRKWEIREAKRNGEVTETLSGLFFEFKDPDTLINIMLGAYSVYQFVFEDQQISQTGSFDMVYDVVSLSDTSLVMSTYIQGYSFYFDLKPAEIE